MGGPQDVEPVRATRAYGPVTAVDAIDLRVEAGRATTSPASFARAQARPTPRHLSSAASQPPAIAERAAGDPGIDVERVAITTHDGVRRVII